MDFHQYKSELLAKIKTEISASQYGAITVYYRHAEPSDNMLYAALKEIEAEGLIEILPQKIILPEHHDRSEVHHLILQGTSTGSFDIRATGTMWRVIHRSEPPRCPPPSFG